MMKLNKSSLMTMHSEIRLVDKDHQSDHALSLSTLWQGDLCTSTIDNNGDSNVRLREAVLFSGLHGLDADTIMYGEGYSKLSQYGGTIGDPKFFGSFNDHTHYKMPTVKGYSTSYNMMMLTPALSETILLAFVSSRRFRGEFRLNKDQIEIVLDLEGLTLHPGQRLELEQFQVFQGMDRERLLSELAVELERRHPKLNYAGPPTGWCSWACYGPGITEEDVEANLEAISERDLPLEFIQIDDGYQAYMGDWFTKHPSFGNDVKHICDKITNKGFKPAIWVAPFIAEKESALFMEHPNWFVMDEEGNPLPSDRDSFGGWRSGPWYMLDGSHPEAREFLLNMFSTMRKEWGVTYFKLDANMWGALPFGKRYDPVYTSIQAYREAMEAILEGAGSDSFVLGCNAPMWPSLGLVHGMRIANDIFRSWNNFHDVAKENFWRNWQHNKLWINDPDAVLLQNLELDQIGPDGNMVKIKSELTPREFIFHATFICATGGMVLSGDRIVDLSEESTVLLKKLLPSTNVAAKFDDLSFQVGRVKMPDKELLFLFNWEDEPRSFEVQLTKNNCSIEDIWSGESLGDHSKKMNVELGTHEARLLICT